MPLVTELLLTVNDNHVSPEGTLKLERFVEKGYLPHVHSQKRPSTHRGYRNIWECHLKSRCGEIRLSDLRTPYGGRLLAEVAKHHDLRRNSLGHIKNLMSGVFKHAKRIGATNGVNPCKTVRFQRRDRVVKPTLIRWRRSSG